MFRVYRILNEENGKSYIGITSRAVEERWEEHLSRSRCTARSNRLYAAIRKYGADRFSVSEIASSESEDEIRQMEELEIRRYDSYAEGYNCNYGGCGHLHIPESLRRKIGMAQKGKIISAESRSKMSLAKQGDERCAINFGQYRDRGTENPKARWYLIQFPDGHQETVCGLREFCKTHGLMHCKLSPRGRTKGFVLLRRLRGHPEMEYVQADGSSTHPDSSGMKIWSTLHGNVQQPETAGRV